MARGAERGVIVLAFAAMYLVGGSVFLGQRVAMHGGLTPFLTSGVRMAIAGAILLAWARARGHRVAPRTAWRDIAISGTLLFVGGAALSMLASQTLDSGLIALITATTPFWITLGAAALPGGERPSSLGALGIGLGFVGLVIVVAPTVHASGGAPLAIAAAAGSVVAWAAGSVWARHRLRGLPAMTVASHQMLCGAVPLIAIGVGRGELATLAPTGPGVLALGYLIVFGNLITYQAFVFLMSRAPASTVATYAFVNPIVALALGAWLAGERLPTHGALGALVLLAGVVLAHLAQVTRTRAAALPQPQPQPQGALS
ncbi:MAG TPA: EamA family transporter [Kofleriaceae bacterium]|nr:EamA family transporter [Kofleriaceae bacterium]